MDGLPTLTQDSPNAVTIRIGKMEIAFSYTTIIGFYSPDTGWRVSENRWSSTTGKHLNALPKGDKARRVPREQFEAELREALAKEGLA